jgi:hypothetical protein
MAAFHLVAARFLSPSESNAQIANIRFWRRVALPLNRLTILLFAKIRHAPSRFEERAVFSLYPAIDSPIFIRNVKKKGFVERI